MLDDKDTFGPSIIWRMSSYARRIETWARAGEFRTARHFLLVNAYDIDAQLVELGLLPPVLPDSL